MHPVTSSPPGHQLIGRDTELARIEQFLGADSACCGTLVITGDRGSGKSALLSAGTTRAVGPRGRRLVRVQHREHAAFDPMRQMLLAVRHDLVALEPAISEPALALLGLAPGTPPADGDLPSLVAAAFPAIAARSPLLIVADDLHDAGDAFAGLLSRLSAAPGTAVLVTSRMPIPPALTGMPVIVLNPLPGDAAERLLADRRPTLTAAARTRVLHRAGGNPAALLELGVVSPPPEGLLAEYVEALAGLPGDTRARLLRGAALGPAHLDLLDAGGHRDGGTDAGTDAAWYPALRAGLITCTGDDVAFAHPLVAEAAYRSAPAYLRLRTHRDLAVALTGHPEHQALQRAAAEPDANEETAAALETAAAIFRGRGDRYAAGVAMHEASLRSPSRQSAARRLTQAIIDARDLRDSAWVAELHARIWHLTDDPDVLAVAAAPAATAMLWAGRYHDAYGIVLAVHHAGRPADRRHALQLTVAAALIAWLTCDEEHLTGLGPMLGAAEPAPDQVAAALVRTLIDPHAHPGREICAAASLPPAGTPLSPEARSRMAHLGMLAWLEDHCRLAVRALQHALADDVAGDLIVRQSSPTLGLLLSRASALIDIGDWRLADVCASPRLAHGMPAVELGFASLRAQLHALRGENEQALTLARQTWQQLDLRANLPAHVRLLRAAGLASIGNGDHDDGYRYLRSMFDVNGRPLHPYLSSRCVADFVVAAVRCGRDEQARMVVDRVRETAGPQPGARMSILLHLSEAMLAGPDRAEEHFRLAAYDPAGPEWPYEHAVAHLHYGFWLRRHRSPREAKALLAHAAYIFTALGAADAGAAEHEIVVGARPHQRDGGFDVDALTTQERQVAELAARGLVNRAIAEQLFLSVRTVSTHLSRIYRKMGIRGRHELATALFAGSAAEGDLS
ncbi:putative LuxR-family transcriptional regulator [Actinoplanes missouriensis 431]|uniref:Putative LuxR-family transcriptional regulator n=1 Tax=Actinoplanes missouriensis (strain ATCC 14538 / DSM 43046 / CBS 188.64 / JCM 3121 / NBRC 102363 / NCIMB 12654 / NRRL B-3342 / UNCC 431) TaxID=512565 RepID=I0H5V1_ACTM4|nr:AAA family ATPase [Actinoplanes missouriensis]BAL88388.1 putative LuxR-family transcriptional regulator [Actinoplanes missouriensis 431]